MILETHHDVERVFPYFSDGQRVELDLFQLVTPFRMGLIGPSVIGQARIGQTRPITQGQNGKLEKSRYIVANGQDQDRDHENFGLDVVLLNEERHSNGEEPLNSDGHGCVTRGCEHDLKERHRDDT